MTAHLTRSLASLGAATIVMVAFGASVAASTPPTEPPTGSTPNGPAGCAEIGALFDNQMALVVGLTSGDPAAMEATFAEITEADWDATMAVNLEAPFLLGRRFAPGMAERGYGRLIHVSSQQAHRAFVGSGIYGVSKGAVESLMRSEAEAWGGRGVTSNSLVPGFVLTPLNARLQEDSAKVAALAARTMIGRNGLPSDFAGAAVFLAGAGSAYVTGHSLFVDGGMSAH